MIEHNLVLTMYINLPPRGAGWWQTNESWRLEISIVVVAHRGRLIWYSTSESRPTSSAIDPDQTLILYICTLQLINGQLSEKIKDEILQKSLSIAQPTVIDPSVGDNATITIQGSYNDVRGNQNITNITNLGGTSQIILSQHNLMIATGHDLVRGFS